VQARFAMDNTEEKLSQAECGRLGGYRACNLQKYASGPMFAVKIDQRHTYS